MRLLEGVLTGLKNTSPVRRVFSVIYRSLKFRIWGGIERMGSYKALK